MSEQIKRNDLVQDGLFRDLAKEIDLATEALQRQTKEAKIVSMGYTDVAKSLKATSQDLATIIELEKKQKKVVDDVQKSRLAEIKLAQDREKAFDRYEKQLQREQAAKEKAAKAAERERIAAEKAAAREKKLNDDKNNAYKQLSANTQKLKDESKRLGAELLKLEQAGRKNTAAYKALDRQYRDVTRSAQAGDAQLKKFDARVGDNFRKVGIYERALRGLNGAIGTLGLAFGAGALINGTRQLLTDINELNLQASRLGVSAENIASFASSSKALSNTFGTDARENMIAANALMKEFNLTQQQAFDLMEQGYLSGANAQGDMLQSVKEYSSQVRASGGDANTLFNILSRAGKEGIYSDKGIDVVKEFGLRVREQTKSTSDAMRAAFGNEFTDQIFGAINNGSMTSVQALELVAEKMKDTKIPTNELQTVIADLFGGPGEDAGLRFIQTLTDITDETANLVDITDPYVKQQMEMQRLNERLAISQQKLYESLGGTGATLDSVILKFKVLFFENIMPAVGLVMKLVAAWGIYNGMVLIAKTRHALLNGTFKKTISGFTDVFKASKQTATGVDAAGQSVKGMGNALKAVGWTAIISVLLGVAQAFYQIATQADQAAAMQDAFNKGTENQAKQLEKLRSNTAKEVDDYKQKLRLMVAEGKITEQIANERLKAFWNEKRFREQEFNPNNQYGGSFVEKSRIDIIKEEVDAIRAKIKIEEAAIRNLKQNEFANRNLIAAKRGDINAMKESIPLYEDYIREIESGNFNLEIESKELKKVNLQKVESINITKSQNTEFAKMNDYISRQTDLLKEIADIETEQQIRQQERNLADLLLGDDAGIADAKVIIDEITNLRQEAINRQYDLDAQRLDEKLAAENKAERDALDKQHEDLIKAAGDDAQAKKTIEDNYQKELDAIALREKARADDVATEKKLLEMKRVEELLALETEREARLNEINESLLSNQKDALAEVNDAISESAKELVNILNQMQSALVEMYTRSIDRKIEAANQDEQLAAEQVNRLQELANQGAILDEQSIADAERRRREAIAEQAELEKKKQRAEFISLALQNIANQLANGKTTGEALGSTVALQSAVKALFSGFNGFWKGTNNAPEGFAWVDEKGSEIHTDKHGNIKDFGSTGGARLKYLEKGDKIIPHHKSMELLNTTLPTVSDKKSAVVDPTLDLLREQNRLLKNAVDSKITAEQLGSVIHMTTEDKKGNLARFNRYKYTK